jgi:uncharacterized protein (DUF488 family)
MPTALMNVRYWGKSGHNYADYAMTEQFRVGLDRLRYLGNQNPSAIMCAEAVWWQCHRRIIADYLMAADEIVFHIMGADRVERAEITEGAKREPDGILTYPTLL